MINISRRGNENMEKLDEKRFAMAGGILWACTLFLTTLLSLLSNYGIEFLKIITSIYPGYSISLAGSILGLIYGFIDAFIAGFIFAWLYNRLPKFI
ncbi:MAG: bacteriophage holin [Candidatus Hydrothermarchaeota archaeon]